MIAVLNVVCSLDSFLLLLNRQLDVNIDGSAERAWPGRVVDVVRCMEVSPCCTCLRSSIVGLPVKRFNTFPKENEVPKCL